MEMWISGVRTFTWKWKDYSRWCWRLDTETSILSCSWAATLSEMELADYCRRMRLFVEQVKEWRAISIQEHEKNWRNIFEETGHCVTQKISYENWRKRLSAKIKLWRKLRPAYIKGKVQCPLGQQRGRQPLSWSGVKLFLLSARPLPTVSGKVRLVDVSVFLFGHFSAGLMATLSLRTEDPIL